MSVYANPPALHQDPPRCPNCGDVLYPATLPLTDEDRRMGVHWRTQIVHSGTGRWECRDGYGNPYTPQVMPVTIPAREALR